MIFVEGRIQTRSWDDKESGKKQYRTEIICENFQMLGSKGDGAGGGRSGGGRRRGLLAATSRPAAATSATTTSRSEAG